MKVSLGLKSGDAGRRAQNESKGPVQHHDDADRA
jgi:hypothetical protein